MMYFFHCIANCEVLGYGVILLIACLVIPVLLDHREIIAIPICIALCMLGGVMMWQAYHDNGTARTIRGAWMPAWRTGGPNMRSRSYRCEICIHGVGSIPQKTMAAIRQLYLSNPQFIRRLFATKGLSTVVRHDGLLLTFSLAQGHMIDTLKVEIRPCNDTPVCGP